MVFYIWEETGGQEQTFIYPRLVCYDIDASYMYIYQKKKKIIQVPLSGGLTVE